MDFVEICKVYVGKMIIKAVKRIFNSDKICRSYSDLNFGVTFLEHSVQSSHIVFISDAISLPASPLTSPALPAPPTYDSDHAKCTFSGETAC